jgi:nucleoid-associated protein YgaU
MAYDKQEVIDVALSEVGYLEKASKSNLDDKTANAGSGNYTKYSRDLAKYPFFNGSKQGAAWCAVFVAWCYDKAYGKAAALKLLCQPTKAANNCGAGCRYAMDYFKAKGQFHTSNPQPGDMIFFYSVDKSSIAHTGLVYKVDNSKVYTVEGNTSGASGVIANGGGVCTKSYSLSYNRIVGYGRPDYGIQTVVVEPVEPPKTNTSYTTYTVKKGDSLWKIAKKLLGSGNKFTQIQKANGLSGSLIKVGQKLKIPKG